MRLDRVWQGHGLGGQLALELAPLIFGSEPPDLMRVLLYRPHFFGCAMSALSQAVLHGPSEWTIGERELFAAWIASQSRRWPERDTRDGRLAALRAARAVAVRAEDLPANLDPKVRVMLPFLAKLANDPDHLNSADLQPVRTAGISEAAIVDGIYVCMVVCSMERLVKAMGCQPVPAEPCAHV